MFYTLELGLEQLVWIWILELLVWKIFGYFRKNLRKGNQSNLSIGALLYCTKQCNSSVRVLCILYMYIHKLTKYLVFFTLF